MKTLRHARNWAVGASVFALMTTTSAVYGQQAPTNAELYHMIQSLQKQQAALVQQARKARAEANKAKIELAATKDELKKAKAKIAPNTEDVQKGTETIAVAAVPLPQQPGGETVMGSQLSTVAVTVDTEPRWFADVSATAIFVGEDGNGIGFYDADGDVVATGIDGKMINPADGEIGFDIAATIGRRALDGKEMRATFAYLHFDESASCTVTGADDVCWVNGLSVNSGIDDRDLNDPGDGFEGDLKIRRIMVDLEKGKTVNLGQDLGLSFAGGLRVAHIDHERDLLAFERNTAGGPIVDSYLKEQDNKIMAGGGKFATALTWRYGNFTFASGLAASLLVANREYSIRETDDSAVLGATPRKTNLLNFDEDEVFLMPVLDGNAQLTWNFLAGSNPAFVAIGYRYQNWFDAIREVRNSDDVDDAQFNQMSQDLEFHGPYFKVGLTWGGAPEPVFVK